MDDALARLESGAPGWCFNFNLGAGELLSARGEELRNIVDGVVGLARIRRTLRRLLPPVLGSLIFVLVRVVAATLVVAGRRLAGTFARRAQILDQLLRNLFQESRRDACLGHVSPIASTVAGAGENEGVHRTRHPDVAKPALFFD